MLEKNMSTIFTVSHAGGQGKTTFSQLLYLLSKRVGVNHKLYSADFMDESGRSKFGKLYPNIVTELGVGANLMAARSENNPNAAVRYWDQTGEIFMNGQAIVDLGANVFPQIVQWAVDRRLRQLMDKKEAPKVDFYCICKAERHGIDDIYNLISELSRSDAFRLGRVFVVLNEVGGPFLKNDFKDRIDHAAGDIKPIYLKLPKCQSEIWSMMEQEGISIESAIEMDEDEIVDMLGVDLWTASSGISELKTWVDYCLKMMRDANIFPNESGQAKRQLRSIS
jgi:hypothetical protein